MSLSNFTFQTISNTTGVEIGPLSIFHKKTPYLDVVEMRRFSFYILKPHRHHPLQKKRRSRRKVNLLNRLGFVFQP